MITPIDLNAAISQIKEELRQSQSTLKKSKPTEDDSLKVDHLSKEAKLALKGKKIYIKRDLLVWEENQTQFDDILKEHIHENNELKISREKIQKLSKKNPSTKMREIFVNKEVLDGVLEEQIIKIEPKIPNEKDDIPKEFHHEKHNKEDLDDPIKTSYLEKFNYFYRSTIISTGTISIVMTANEANKIESIPNPFAVSHGNLIIDDGNSSLEDDNIWFEEKGKIAFEKHQKSPIKKMQKYLHKTPNKTKVFESLNAKKQRHSEMNTKELITNLILDIPEESRFYEILKADIKHAREKGIDNISSDEDSEDELDIK